MGACVPSPVRTFQQRAADIDWYCELRGAGPDIVLIPSGEGDCASFTRVAELLADEFRVLTFDMPGFSRSGPPPDFAAITADDVAAQIAALLRALRIDSATVYGCSSGGLFALALAATQSDLVRNVLVHEVAAPPDPAVPLEPASPFAALFSPDDTVVVKTCQFLYRNVMNENPAAWDALGLDFHERLARNYVTWARRYVAAPRLLRTFNRSELTRRPITWTVGTVERILAGNRKLADVADLPIGFLPCRHFPQVSIPEQLAAHIRDAARAHL